MITMFLPLAGKSLELDRHRLRFGTPRVCALKPRALLAARMVTIKGFMEPEPFQEAARRQLDALGISHKAEMNIPRVPNGRKHSGKHLRRVLRIKDKTVVGFALHVHGLTAEESLMLQERGLGGRRHMGCGIFVPIRGLI
jgi:CRISPR-associated protein Cas6